MKALKKHIGNWKTYLAHSTPMGLPLICSGHAPIVKLGAPGDRFRWVPPDDCGSGVEVVGDVMSPHTLLLGDLDGVRGDRSPVMFSISQFLQSTPCWPWCSEHCRDRWNCCCCWCRNSLNNFAAAAAFVLARSCCCCCVAADDELLLMLATADDVDDDGEFCWLRDDDCCWLFITLLLLLVKLLFVLLLALLELSVPLLLVCFAWLDGDIDDVLFEDEDELLCARWFGDFSRDEEELLFNNIADDWSFICCWSLLLLLFAAIACFWICCTKSLINFCCNSCCCFIETSDEDCCCCCCCSSGSRNDSWGFSSLFRCKMALEYSRLSNSFSDSCKFTWCSVLACRVKDFVLPKLNLQIKHINIGLWIFVWLLVLVVLFFDVLSGDTLILLPVLIFVAVPLLFDSRSRSFTAASRADTTRNEWIFGLFDCGTPRFVSEAWDSFSESIMYALPSGLYTIFPWNVSTSEHDAGEPSSESYSYHKINDNKWYEINNLACSSIYLTDIIRNTWHNLCFNYSH